MPTITRSWLAFAAIGTGLIHVALVVGAPIPFAIVLGAFGLVEFGWGVLTFARETLIAPRAALVIGLLPVLAWALLLATAGGTALPLLPLAVASLFELFVVAVLGVHLRRRRTMDAAPPVPGVGRYVLGLAVGAAVVAGLTAPAIAATPVGGAAPVEVRIDIHGH